eukprot:g4988.t1
MGSIIDADFNAKSSRLIPFDSAELNSILTRHKRTDSITRKKTASTSKLSTPVESLPRNFSLDPLREPRLHALELVDLSGGAHSRNLSLPAIPVLEGTWTGVMRREAKHCRATSMVTMLFGQKREDTVVTVHGNALFDQSINVQPHFAQCSNNVCMPIQAEEKMRDNRSQTSPKSSSSVLANSKLGEHNEVWIPTSASEFLSNNTRHSRHDRTSRRKVKTIDNIQVEGVLDMDIVVDTAKSAFRRTIQNSLVPKYKTKELSCDSIEPIGVGCYQDEMDIPVSAKTLDEELEYGCRRRSKKNKFNDINPPLNEEDARIEPQRLDSKESFLNKCLRDKVLHEDTSGGTGWFWRKKCKRKQTSKTFRPPKKPVKRSDRVRIFRACFGGGFSNVDKDSERRTVHNEHPDPPMLPSRLMSANRHGGTHRYSSRQAFIRTMMESHLNNHRNRLPL